MIKRDEVLDKNSCLNRAKEDEFIFTLLGRDSAVPATIRFWADKRVEMGKNKYSDPQIVKALKEADEVEAQQLGPKSL